jgi:hypothetical protein
LSLAEQTLLVLFWKRTIPQLSQPQFFFSSRFAEGHFYLFEPRRTNAFGSFLDKNNSTTISASVLPEIKAKAFVPLRGRTFLFV